METKKYELPKEFASKWVEALRSGKYKQIKEMLYNKEACAYCCLGVAGHLQGIPNMDMNKVGELYELNSGLGDDDNDIEFQFSIPKEIVIGKLKAELISLNDDEGKSFDEIADWIEANVNFI